MILDNPKHRKFYNSYSPHSYSAIGRPSRGVLRAQLSSSLKRTRSLGAST